MSALTLTRIDRSAGFGNWKPESATGHPPIPPVEDVIRRYAMGRDHRKSAEPTAWFPHSAVWDAVMALHQSDRHDDAAALAKLFRWCDSHGHDYVWQLDGGESR